MKWWDKYPSIEEVKLVAWHHMMNDPYASVYTFEDGQEERKLVNPNIPTKPKWYNQSELTNLNNIEVNSLRTDEDPVGLG